MYRLIIVHRLLTKKTIPPSEVSKEPDVTRNRQGLRNPYETFQRNIDFFKCNCLSRAPITNRRGRWTWHTFDFNLAASRTGPLSAPSERERGKNRGKIAGGKKEAFRDGREKERGNECTLEGKKKGKKMIRLAFEQGTIPIESYVDYYFFFVAI